MGGREGIGLGGEDGWIREGEWCEGGGARAAGGFAGGRAERRSGKAFEEKENALEFWLGWI